eukprot:GFUD01083146.1.p1 GENE.GFUD01083146.1~~GFUD01083146.1.p1  ORF type:complete len:423 (-),score=123.60 GFUD01083146.1:151-1419(-)
MGCVASKLDINDVHPNMFAVNNVDDLGSKLNPGQLEITDTDLVLHQKGKQPIKWPLKYLKRYGFDAGLFSFEAGRKNPTGPGIYAFKCRRAENLFNLLQVRVRNQAPNSGSITDGSVSLASPPGDRVILRGDSSPQDEPATPRWPDDASNAAPNNNDTVQYGQISETENSFFPTNQPIMADATTPQSSYMNCSLPPQPGVTSSPPRVPPLHTTQQTTPGYMNITQEGPHIANKTSPNSTSLSLLTRSSSRVPPLPTDVSPDPRHDYENVGPETAALHSPGYLPPRNVFALPPKPAFLTQISATPTDISDPEPQQAVSQDQTPPVSPCRTGNSINYIVLDLDTSATPATKQTSPALKTRNEETETQGPKCTQKGYVTIDFDKTVALNKSANQRFFEDDEPGIRKTRHNSSLSGLGNGKIVVHN